MENRKKQNYKNLSMWQVAMQITNDVFEILSECPLQEKYDSRPHIERFAISTPSNITLGSARTKKSFPHITAISLGP